MKIYASYNDVDVYFFSFEDDKGTKFCKARKRFRQKYDVCPFCQKDVKEGSILTFINNWKLFPNTIVHEACCNGFPSKEDAMKYLHEDYQAALKYKQKYMHWFNAEQL